MGLKLKTIALVMFVCVQAGTASAAVLPRASSYDSHMQTVSYNSQNTTVIYTRPGYVTTLIFDDDETVVDATPGFEKAWDVKKNDNRVSVQPMPITQPVTDAEGKNAQQVFEPNSKDWKTNLFITTTKRYYSLILNVLDTDAPNLSFVVRYHYPEDEQKKASDASALRENAARQMQERQQIESAFKRAAMPRNWSYTRRVAKNSEAISPDYMYDDGRFTYIGFSPYKIIPSPFTVDADGGEQVVTPIFVTQGNYKVMIIRTLTPRFVLRYGNAVVGIENTGFGKVQVANTETASPAVALEAK